jgi:hypothetical protein
MQYRRAVQLYYKKFQRYPPNVEALIKTNEIRFLRKKYKDPITGKDDWKPVLLGQNKTPLAMGFFGQPLSGVGFGGMLPGGGMVPGGGLLPAGGGLQGGNGFSAPGSPAGGATDANGNPVDPSAGSPSIGGNPGGPGANPANPGDPTAGGSQNSGGSQIFGANPVGGQAFGGAGIVGFSPASEKQSILVYKKKNHYNEWEFTYSPISDMGMGGFQQAPPQLLGGQAPGTGGLSPTPAPGPAPGPSTPTAPAPQQ